MAFQIGRRGFVGGGLATLAAPAAAPGDSPWRTQAPYWEKEIPQIMTEYHVPGLSIAVIENAKIVWRRGFGVKDVESKVPVTTDTMFEAASMSKPVFSYAVMKLWERGVIDIDAPLTKYTPVKFVDDPRLDLITARRVLCHTTGLPNWRSKDDPLRINFTPGEKWSYAGEGYHYLQLVMTGLVGHTDSSQCKTMEDGYHVCATDFGDYMGERLLRPFGMISSGYVWNHVIEKKMSRPHDKDGRPMKQNKSSAVDVARYGSAGALLSTPSDYARFLIEVIDPKPADAVRLKRDTLNAMVHPQIDLPVPADYPFHRASWALGWMILRPEGGDLISHGGDNDGFHCQSVASLERKSGFVVMTNGERGYELIGKHLKYLVSSFV